jgi:hypothetical protein
MIEKLRTSRCDMVDDAILLRRREVEELLKENGKIVEKRYIRFTPFPVRPFRFLAPFLPTC